MGVSQREAARQLGVTEGAVRKRKKSGDVVLCEDGTIDVEKTRVVWSRRVDPARSKVKSATPSNATGAIRTEQDARDAITLLRRVLVEEGADANGTIDFNMARIAETILKAREREQKMAQRRKELVPLARVKSHIEKAFIGYRQAMQRLASRHVAAIAAEVGCDPGKLDAALSKAIAAELDELSAPVIR
jgi:hypothetical protein